jgi:hypothetical protein
MILREARSDRKEAQHVHIPHLVAGTDIVFENITFENPPNQSGRYGVARKGTGVFRNCNLGKPGHALEGNPAGSSLTAARGRPASHSAEHHCFRSCTILSKKDSYITAASAVR